VLAPAKPTRDELEALIKEARERQARRRLIGAAAVAIAAATGLGVYAFVAGGRTDGGNDGSPAPSLAAPLCRASQFSSTAGLNGAVGTLVGTVILTNTSADACSLPTGRPHVSVLWQGHVLPTQNRGERSSGRPIRVLGPHSSAAIDMDWANWCGGLDHRTAVDPTFRLSWADRLTVDVPNGIAVPPPRCNGGGPSLTSAGRPYRNALLAP
jgi:hypothetical protein